MKRYTTFAGVPNELPIRSYRPNRQALGAHGDGGQGGENSHSTLSDSGPIVHDTTIIVRYDGIMADFDGDNLCFTIRSHFVGADGRDYFNTSWIGVIGLLRAGVNLERVRVVTQ